MWRGATGPDGLLTGRRGLGGGNIMSLSRLPLFRFDIFSYMHPWEPARLTGCGLVSFDLSEEVR